MYLPIILYVLAQSIRDFRRGNFVIAGIGAVCLAWVFMNTPIPTHAVRLDLPQPASVR
jgi:hypothetical protein